MRLPVVRPTGQLGQLSANDGPQLVAALRCDPNVGSVLFRGLNLDVPEDQNACVLDALIAETARVPWLDLCI